MKGALSSLYLAKKGTYTADADSRNSYTLAQVEVRRQLHARVLSSRRTSKFLAGTRYDEDFLSKPRPQIARREGRRSSSDQESDVAGDRSASTRRDPLPTSSSKGQRTGSSRKRRADAGSRETERGAQDSAPQSSGSEDNPSFTIIEDPPPAADDLIPAVSADLPASVQERGQAEYSEELRRKLGVIETQLSRLREARKQIDSAIATLENMRERCTAPGS